MSDSSFFSTIRHSVNYFSAYALTKAAGIIYIPVLTRLLTPEEYGVHAMYSSWIPILVVVMTLNTFSATSRYYYEGKSDFPDFMGTTILLVVGTFTPFVIVVIAFRSMFANLLSIPEKTVGLLLISILMSVISSVFEEIWQARRKSKFLAVCSIVRVYSSMILTIGLAFYLEKDLYMAPILGTLIVGLAFAFFYLYKLLPFIQFRLKIEHALYILPFVLPMILSNLSGLMLERFDTLMIGKIISIADAGLYSFAYMIGGLLWIGTSALYAAWIPVYFKYMNASDYRSHDEDTVKLMNIVALAASFLILFGGELGMLLAGSNFHKSLVVVPYVVMGYFFLAVHDVYKRHFMFLKKTQYLFVAPLMSGLLNIGLNLLFIPVYGYMAAAINTLVSYFVMAVIAWWLVKYRLKFHATPVRYLIIPTGAQFIALAVLMLSPCMVISYWQVFIVKLLLLFIVTYVLIRKMMSTMFIHNRKILR